MKKQHTILNIFSITAMIAILGGAVVFVLFLMAFIIGGERGGAIALFGKNSVMPVFIRIAAISLLFGLIHTYLIARKKKEEKR